MILGGVDISDWPMVIGGRELPDGRILVAYRQIFNFKLTVSTPRDWPHGWSDAW